MIEIELYLKSVNEFKLNVIRDSINKKLIEFDNEDLMDNREVKVLLEKHFGNKTKLSYSQKVNTSLLCFLSDVCSALNKPC